MRPPAPSASLSGTGVLDPPSDGGATGRRSDSEAPPSGSGDGDGDEGHGGGGGGWNEDGWFGGQDDRWRRRGADPETIEFAFRFVLTTVGTLFAIFLGAYLMLRSNATEWPPPGSPGAPAGLLWSTLLLVVSDLSMRATRRAHRRGAARPAHRLLAATIVLGVAFLTVQVILWRDVIGAAGERSRDAYGVLFLSLTGLHALHVVGGIVFLAAVGWRACRVRELGAWTLPLKLAAHYWHLLDGIWLVLFLVL